MEFNEQDRALYEYIEAKNEYCNKALNCTKEAFKKLKETAKAYIDYLKTSQKEANIENGAEYKFIDKGEMDFRLQFSHDVLVFSMHTNVFEFSRNHEVMKTQYIKQDSERSMCGVIFIYNFLSDSILYERAEDIGYLIGRVFINKENHYFIEGKQELGLLYTHFNSAVFEEQSAQGLLRAAMEYASHFDPLTPPYDSIKEISVMDLEDDTVSRQSIALKTGKRLGFQFKADL